MNKLQIDIVTVYAYLQKAALTFRLILEALPIPSRRHRSRVWVTYLSIKVLLRQIPGWLRKEVLCKHCVNAGIF